MDEANIEQTVQAKGLTAPRLTPAQIDATISAEDYHVFPGSQLTVCCLTLANGFTVTGESACVSPENFNEELGRQIARGHARDKIWALEGYLLKQSLSERAKQVA
jgi:Phage protein (N4 Gp49/phage Sf6 gene 66) family